MNWKAVRKTTIAWLIGLGIVSLFIGAVIQWGVIAYWIIMGTAFGSMLLFVLYHAIRETYKYYDKS